MNDGTINEVWHQSKKNFNSPFLRYSECSIISGWSWVEMQMEEAGSHFQSHEDKMPGLFFLFSLKETSDAQIYSLEHRKRQFSFKMSSLTQMTKRYFLIFMLHLPVDDSVLRCIFTVLVILYYLMFLFPFSPQLLYFLCPCCSFRSFQHAILCQ